MLAVFCACPLVAMADDDDDDAPVVLKAATPLLDTSQRQATKLFGSAQVRDGSSHSGVPQQNQPIEYFRGSTLRKIQPLSGNIKESATPPPELKQQEARADKQAILKGRDAWFRIPSWMAGTWQTKDKILLGEVNFRTGKQTPPRQLKFGYCFEPYGLQQDENGAYWQFEKVGGIPSNYKIDNNGVGHYNAVDSYFPLSSSNTQLVLQKNWHTAAVNPDTNEILGTSYLQSILTFTLSGSDQMNVEEVVTSFGKNGMPVSRRVTQAVRCRVEPYKPIAKLHGDDVRASFTQYMATR